MLGLVFWLILLVVLVKSVIFFYILSVLLYFYQMPQHTHLDKATGFFIYFIF